MIVVSRDDREPFINKLSVNNWFEMGNSSLSKFERYLTKIFLKIKIKLLVKVKDLVIQKADKGDNIVILNRSDYISKLSKILDDTSKFKRVNIKQGKALNHLIHMEERIICLLKSLEDQGEISEKEKKDLYPSGSQLGVLYGLAKIHKALEDGIPSFRPILSAIGTPTYKLNFVINYLSHLQTMNIQ